MDITHAVSASGKELSKATHSLVSNRKGGSSFIFNVRSRVEHKEEMWVISSVTKFMQVSS